MTARKKTTRRKRVTPARKPEAQEDRREEIRHAAFTCFSAKGYHETRLEDICAEAGVSRGTFYWYFKSKEAVFLEILEVWTREVQEQVRGQFSGAFQSEHPQAALLRALIREGKRGRRVIPLWIDGLVQSRNHPEMREALARFLASVRATIAEVIRPAFAPFHREEEIEQLASLFLSCFIGSISQEIADPDGVPFDRQVRQLVTTTNRFARLIVADGESAQGTS
jgi:AcrR family transcriptional regulator